MKVVTSAALGPPNRLRPPPAPAARLSSVVSIGSSLRYSMRRATSAAVGAEIVPFTISPAWVRAR